GREGAGGRGLPRPRRSAPGALGSGPPQRRLGPASGSAGCPRRSGRADPQPRCCRDLEKTSAPPYPLAVAIRVVLADDHYLVREGVRSLLEAEPGLEVAAVCDDLDSLLEAVDAERPDV